MERIAVKFGTTAEELHRVLAALAQKQGWELSHIQQCQRDSLRRVQSCRGSPLASERARCSSPSHVKNR